MIFSYYENENNVFVNEMPLSDFLQRQPKRKHLNPFGKGFHVNRIDSLNTL